MLQFVTREEDGALYLNGILCSYGGNDYLSFETLNGLWNKKLFTESATVGGLWISEGEDNPIVEEIVSEAGWPNAIVDFGTLESRQVQ